jgi:hypothetical protein
MLRFMYMKDTSDGVVQLDQYMAILLRFSAGLDSHLLSMISLTNDIWYVHTRPPYEAHAGSISASTRLMIEFCDNSLMSIRLFAK